MEEHLGCIVRFTDSCGTVIHGIVVDYHPNTGLCGIRWDDDTCLVTLWSKVGDELPGTKSELLPPDTSVKWCSAKLRIRINCGEIEGLIEESRQRLTTEKKKLRSMTLDQWQNPLIW